jgi:hypothetical protein
MRMTACALCSHHTELLTYPSTHPPTHSLTHWSIHSTASPGPGSLGLGPAPQTQWSSQYGFLRQYQQRGSTSRGSTTALCSYLDHSCCWSTITIRATAYSPPSQCQCAFSPVLGSTTNQEEKSHDYKLSGMSTSKIEV